MFEVLAGCVSTQVAVEETSVFKTLVLGEIKSLATL